MRHVFVETNWVFAFAAPAHHKRIDAVELMACALRNDLRLHLPSICLTEARRAIVRKCQPRNEARAIRDFVGWAKSLATVSAYQEKSVYEVLDHFERQVQAELNQLHDIIGGLRANPGIEVYPLNDRMLEKSMELGEMDLGLRPFDQAILGAVLGRAEELRRAGETDVCFCEIDSDLQPWFKGGAVKQPLRSLYDEVGIWVFEDFSLTKPQRPENWPSA